MKLRARLRLAFLAIVLLPLVGFALGVRKAMSDRLTAQYQRRVEALVSVIRDDLALKSEEIRRRLATLAISATQDNRLRLAAVDDLTSERTYLLDYAGNAMRLAGLSMLQIQNVRGRILSSGHFRNEYDRIEAGLARRLSAAPGGAALLEARTPEGPFLALAAVDSFTLGGRRFSVVGGESVERSFLTRLAREDDLTVSLIYPGGSLTSADADSAAVAAAGDGAEAAVASEVIAELAVPYIDAERSGLTEARIVVMHGLGELEALRRDVDRWFLIGVGVTALLAFLLATWLASRISRPLAALARKTASINLDHLNVDFRSGRKDEVGSLARLLGAMTERLRTGAARLKEAERRATIGELARQVNHDIKNGLMPIRNVLRHLTQVARDEPEQLRDVFDERQSTIDSSISYLEDLASNYARLYPRVQRRPCDVDDVVGQVVSSAEGQQGIELLADLDAGGANVIGDPVALRRIVENLIDNAIDSIGAGPGSVAVATRIAKSGNAARTVRVSVADTGCGMSEEQVSQIFDDFYTTKEEGTGLGLSIVRRLVLDLNGSIRVESEAGQGSRFIVDLPASDANGEADPGVHREEGRE